MQRNICLYKKIGVNKIVCLILIIPLVLTIAQKSGNQVFLDELNDFISLIQYDEEEVYNELNEAMQKALISFHDSKLNI